jgi:hypothetical protein
MNLTKAKRDKLPKSDFGLPKSEGYPMPDKNHARLAKSGASHAERVGHISKATEEKIDAKADRVLGKGGARSKEHANVRNPSTHAGKLKHE